MMKTASLMQGNGMICSHRDAVINWFFLLDRYFSGDKI